MAVWDWITDFQNRAQAAHDAARLRLVTILGEAASHSEDNPDRAVELLREGSRLARMLHEPWWELLFDSGRVDILLYTKRDCGDEVRGLAVRNALRARSPAFAGFPLHFQINRALVSVYLGRDPLGYAAAIREALGQLEREFPVSGEDLYALLSTQRVFAAETGRLDDAVGIAMKALGLMDADPSETAPYAIDAYASLCWVAFQTGDWQSLAGWARCGEQSAGELGQPPRAAEFVMWQAVCARRGGDARTARRQHRRGVSLAHRLGQVKANYYWDALAAYHELGGDIAAALSSRRAEFGRLRGQGRLADECSNVLAQCRLLALLGRLTGREVRLAREAAGKMRAPAKYLAELEAIINESRPRPRERPAQQGLSGGREK
jgi:hypothetical protein